MTRTERGVVTEKSFQIRSLGSQSVGGTDYFVRRTSSGTDYLIKQDKKGIYRVGKRTIVDLEVTMDPEPRFVLKYPLEAGTSWVVKTHPYVIRRVHPYVEFYHRSITFPMNYHIESTDATVRVPAGVFKNCIEVVGEADLTMYVDPRIGWGELPVTTHEWYALGVGLVKLERTEKLDTGVFVGGTMVMELTEFDY
ncbi:MAG: hypothetical protein JRE16_09855 [Deltaproteobacteria bacterium]|nr:hypothetical protein [Deltaproteobacteria bacterium]